MRTLILIAFMACGAPPMTPPIDPAPGQFLEAWRGRDLTAAGRFLSKDALFIDPTGEFAAADGLAKLQLPASALIDKHHDVARLSLDDGSLLFVKSDGQGAIVAVLRFPATGTSATPAPIKAYQDAWNVERSSRRFLLEAGWTAASRYVDATAEGHGADGLSRVIDGFRAQFRGASVVAEPELQHLPGGWVTFNWTITSGSSVLHGFDVGQLGEDDRLRFIAGFFSPR